MFFEGGIKLWNKCLSYWPCSWERHLSPNIAEWIPVYIASPGIRQCSGNQTGTSFPQWSELVCYYQMGWNQYLQFVTLSFKGTLFANYHICACVSFLKDHPSILFWVCRIWSLSIVLAFVKLRSGDALPFFCLCHVCVFQQRTVFDCCLFDSYYNKFIFHVILDSHTTLFVRFLISVPPRVHCLDQVSPVSQIVYIWKMGKGGGGGITFPQNCMA